MVFCIHNGLRVEAALPKGKLLEGGGGGGVK